MGWVEWMKYFLFWCHMSSEFIRRAMNKENALRRLPSVSTTAAAIAAKFMHVMHFHKWTFVGTPSSKYGCHCNAGNVCHRHHVSNQ